MELVLAIGLLGAIIAGIVLIALVRRKAAEQRRIEGRLGSAEERAKKLQEQLQGAEERVKKLKEQLRSAATLNKKLQEEATRQGPAAPDLPRSNIGATMSMISQASPDCITKSMLPHRDSADEDEEKQEGMMVNHLHPETFRWIKSTRAEQKFLGRTLAELRQMSFLDVVHAGHVDAVRQQLQRVVKRGEAHDLKFRVHTANGEPRWAKIDAQAFYDPISHRPLDIRCFVQDITPLVLADREQRRLNLELRTANEGLRRLNAELQELKDRYSDLYQNAPAFYFSLDADGVITQCNQTMVNALGYRRDAIVHQSYLMLLPLYCRELFSFQFAKFKAEGTINTDKMEWQKKDGSVIDVEVRGVATYTADHQFESSRFIAQDISVRKRLEIELFHKNASLQQANDQLQRINKELDDFSYVVSHDLKEPLRTIMAFSNFLREDYRDQLAEQGQEYLQFLVEATERMNRLIGDLLELSRAGRVAGEWTTFAPEEIVDAVKLDLTELIRRKGGTVRVEGPLPMLWGDRNRIQQLLANLVSNGLKYNESPAPEVVIGSRAGPAGGEPGGRVTLFVRDNGIGIAPEFQGKIFEIFKRLHPREKYEGTGAGLAICKKIVEAHQGRIWVESQPGQGATFSISLPAAPRPPADGAPHTERAAREAASGARG